MSAKNSIQVTCLGHACYLVEFEGTRVLTDPWLVDPIFSGFVRREPALRIQVADLPKLDAIAITHAHLDHFNAPTLQAIEDKTIPVIHPTITLTNLDNDLATLGFRNQRSLADWESTAIGSIRITATPSLNTLDECALLFTTEAGSFWNGADAPQPESLQDEIANRFGPIDIGAFGHNGFDQPALLGLESHKPANHALEAACSGVEKLGVKVALAGASNMRWTGVDGPQVTKRTIRQTRRDFVEAVGRLYPDVIALDLPQGTRVNRWGEQATGVRGTGPAPDTQTDYLHALGENNTGPPLVSNQDLETWTYETLPELTSTRSEASSYVNQAVSFQIVAGPEVECFEFCYDFRSPGSPCQPSKGDLALRLRVDAAQWQNLLRRQIPWQVLLVSGGLRVENFEDGPPPAGLHAVYALQALFP